MAQETGADLSLKTAIREARFDEMTRQDAICAMREAEFGRLSLLADYLRPVFDDIPAHIDLFDVGVIAGDRPRYFIDMVAFVEMDEGKHVYCLYQDTRAGRMLLGRSAKREEAAKLVLDYVARRLVAREQLLAMPIVLETPVAVPARVEISPAILAEHAPAQAVMSTQAVQTPEQVKVLPEAIQPQADKTAQQVRPTISKVEVAKTPLKVKLAENLKTVNTQYSSYKNAIYVIAGAVLATSAYVLLSRLLDMALQK
jgi:hypothetical protein